MLSSLLLVLAAAPQVAVLSTAADAERSELRFQPIGERTLAPIVASVGHLRGESVQASLIPGTRQVLVVAVTEPWKDLSFASALFVVEAGKPARKLADRIALGTRPLVTREGRVFVQRGRTSGTGVDPLTVEEVDVSTGRTREVLAFTGSTAFLAGSAGRELLVYRVGAEGADLVAVHADALGVRALLTLPPFARDFAVTDDERSVVFTDFDGRWFAARFDLHSRAVTRLTEGPTMALLPTPWPDGRIGWAAAGEGLRDRRGVLLPAQGPGYERVRAFVKGTPIGLHETPGEFPLPIGFSAPQGVRLELAGVVP